MEEYNLQKRLKKGIEDLMKELLVIQDALQKVSEVPLDQLDTQVKIWANDVRELSYAIEDSLDSFMVCVEGLEPTKPYTFLGFIKKTCKKATKLKIRREIANDINDVKIQVRDVKDRYDRYKGIIGSTNVKTEVDPRLFAMYTKVSDIVGIDKAMDKLMKMLSETNDVSDENLKVVSVVGFGGLGKTTLAKAVYHKLNKNFDCGGFVPVGQNPRTKKVLRDILLELDTKLYKVAATMDERQMIDQLKNFLARKRYFIVIDDLWDVRIWETIKYAFMDSHPESRLMITTRIVDVAKKAGGIYNMEPLSNDNSKILFDARTAGGEGLSSSNQHAEVTAKILNKCGGVPLAIITIASLLVGKQIEDWSKVYDAIGFGREDNEVVHNTRKILSFSYYDLPSHLKACLLYLCMFPEDSFIEKKSLIWRWVSEGFVLDREGLGSFQLGESYFSELVNRSMIRLEEGHGCRVHDMVLDLIRTISNEINFVTVHDMEHHASCSRGKPTNKVSRLALHGRSVEQDSSTEMKHVRTFSVITCINIRMPMLLGFKVLRVLVIEGCKFLEGHSLEHIGKLVQLRYLGVVETAAKLPEGIGHDLKFLEILDVRGGLISELPLSLGELINLRCLWADDGTVMKGEIGKLTSLEELELYSVDKCPNFFTDVEKLTKLRVLKIYLDEIEELNGKVLTGFLKNLHKIQTLKVSVDDYDDKDSLVRGGCLEDMVPSKKLCSFLIFGIIIPRVPSWIDFSCVPLLSELYLDVEAVEDCDIRNIGRLTSLLHLFLWSKNEKYTSYTFGRHEFQKLTILSTKKVEITIAEGALPMLEQLVYSARIQSREDAASLVPWNDGCPLLKDVGCWLDCANCGYREVKGVEEALRQATKTHSNAKYLHLQIDKENYDQEGGNRIDELEWILHGLDMPEEVGRPAAQLEDRIRWMTTSLEIKLHDAAEPRVGRYGEQEIRGLVTKFKSWLEDHATNTNQEEVAGLCLIDLQDNDDEDYYYNEGYGDDRAETSSISRTVSLPSAGILSLDSGGGGEQTLTRSISLPSPGWWDRS